MRKILASLISIYQTKISPRKGFTCAHRGLYGGESCSEYTKQQILERGVFASLKPIRSRFNECHDAAVSIHNHVPRAQRGELDCGLGGCDSCGGDVGSVSADVGSGSGGDSSGGGSFIGDCSVLRSKRGLYVILAIVLLVASWLLWSMGQEVSSIKIRLNEGVEESRDSALSGLLESRLPDYRVNFSLESGSWAVTNTYQNVSAKEWITLKPTKSFHLSDVSKMTIVNKGAVISKELESFTSPEKEGKGKRFEYIIQKKWDNFL